MNCNDPEDCSLPAVLKGLCKKHYARQWRVANPEVARAASRKWQARQRAENGDALREYRRNYARQWNKDNPGRARDNDLRKKYGFDFSEVLARVVRQRGCAGCGGQFDKWVVDHDHSCCATEDTCGSCVRGILCRGCNVTLGNTKDSPETLRRLAGYIESYREVSQ